MNFCACTCQARHPYDGGFRLALQDAFKSVFQDELDLDELIEDDEVKPRGGGKGAAGGHAQPPAPPPPPQGVKLSLDALFKGSGGSKTGGGGAVPLPLPTGSGKPMTAEEVERRQLAASEQAARAPGGHASLHAR